MKIRFTKLPEDVLRERQEGEVTEVQDSVGQDWVDRGWAEKVNPTPPLKPEPKKEPVPEPKKEPVPEPEVAEPVKSETRKKGLSGPSNHRAIFDSDVTK